MKRNVIETLVGALVLLIAGGFALFAYQNAGISHADETYPLIAKFERADGIKSGSDVRIGGVKVGVVSNASLDSTTYLAQIELSLDKKIKLPTDSSAQIVSDGLLGGKYIALVPGADDAMLAAGGEITFTQSSVNLETLIGKMIFSDGDKKGPAKKESGNDSVAPATTEENKDAPTP